MFDLIDPDHQLIATAVRERIKEFDDDYWSRLRDHEKRVRDELMDGKRHVFEAEMKEDRRTKGRDGHEATP